MGAPSGASSGGNGGVCSTNPCRLASAWSGEGWRDSGGTKPGARTQCSHGRDLYLAHRAIQDLVANPQRQPPLVRLISRLEDLRGVGGSDEEVVSAPGVAGEQFLERVEKLQAEAAGRASVILERWIEGRSA
ncbi:MAG: hypothetical protein Q9186_000790 [Xanthomendoza sp. 1 TL-2023]